MKQINKKYEYPMIATDVVILMMIEDELNVLLIKMNKEPFKGKWAMPGSLINGSESIDQSVKRVMKEKTGVSNVYLEQLYTFGEVNRDPFGRVVSVAYIALLPTKELELLTTEEHKEVKWFKVSELPKLAYDHDKILKLAIERIQNKIRYTNVISHLLPKEFTLTDLQKAYEIILGKEIDKRNFRKKINSLKIIEETGNNTIGGAHRPAKLFKFIDKKVKIVDIL